MHVDAGRPDIIPDVPDYHVLRADESQVCVQVLRIGQAHVADGKSITIHPIRDANAAQARQLIYGAAMAALLYQRRVFPVHASAVARDGRAVILTGPSGAGKSTLVLALQTLGWDIICDDLVGINHTASVPVLRSGVCALRIRDDSLTALSAPVEDGIPKDRMGKRWILCPFPGDPFAPYRLAAVIYLEQADSVSLKPLKSHTAFAKLVSQSPLSHATHRMQRSDCVLHTVTRICSDVPILSLSRTSSFSDLPCLMHLLDDALNEAVTCSV